ncbi:MAG: MFS transporter [Bacteroides sp.]|nr:MFS transporter [Roseburia sp.]MCM1347123.1 MFS transporter [Bacteroides sp.]MCM1421588.1 MFS transporter [Bacteroides sp.]
MKNNSVLKVLPVLFGFFVMGFCDIVGISSDYAKQAFGWSDTMAGFVPSMVFVWFLFLGIPTGILMNRFGRKNAVLFSFAVTIIGMILPLVAYNSVTCMLAYSMLGIGNAILQVSLNPLLNNVVTNEKLLTSSLTAGQIVKAVSSLVGPWIVSFAVAYFGNGDNGMWYYCFPILGAVTLLSGLWLMLTPIEREVSAASSDGQLKGTLSLLSDSTILRLFLGIFFVVGIDVATNFISSKLMIERFGWTVDEAGMAPQVYFLCRTIGAFIGMFAMTKIAEAKYFRINIVLCIAVILALAFTTDVTVNLVCVGAIGFLCSCIFPIIYSMALQSAPDKANYISGLMITAVAGGGAATPLIGWARDMSGSITAGVFVLLVCALYLAYCAFGVRVVKK